MLESLLKRFDFSSYILGNIITQVASDLAQFAISLYVLEVTGSAMAFASLLSVIVIPRLLLSPFAGVVADRLNRKSLLMLLNLSNAVVLTSLGLFYGYSGIIPIWLLYVYVIYLEIVEIFYQPAASAVFPSILQKDQLASANSIQQTIMAISAIGSPMLAALVYQQLPLNRILTIAGVLYIVAMLSKLALDLKYQKRDNKEVKSSFITDFKEGIDYLGTNSVLVKSTVFAGVINLFLSPIFIVVLPFMIREVFQLDAIFLGYIQSIAALGMVVGGIVSFAVNKRYRLGSIFVATVRLLALIFVVLTVAVYVGHYQLGQTFPTYIAICIAIFSALLSVVSVNVAMSTFMQTTVPLALMGRVSTVTGMIAMGAMPLGNLLYGLLADRFNLTVSFALPAVALIISLYAFRDIKDGLNQMVEAANQVREQVGEKTIEQLS